MKGDPDAIFDDPLLAVLLAASMLAPVPDLLSLSKHVGRAQDRHDVRPHVLCCAPWVTFRLPDISEAERKEIMAGALVVNQTQRTVLSIRKSAVRNLMFCADTGGGEGVFFLETGSIERPRVFYSALVTEQVYRDGLACLNATEEP